MDTIESMKRIIGLSGSLRKNSFNTALLNKAGDFLPDGFTLNIIDPGTLPLYNEDLALNNTPETVLAFRSSVNSSNGMLIASPEYNYSFTGVLKNALDWAGTDTLGNILSNMPIAIMGASKTVFGTVRSQLHLRQVLGAANADVVRKPEVYVRRAQDLIESNGIIKDERTIEKVQSLLNALIENIQTGN